MDATKLLEKQHRKVEAILKKLERGNAAAAELLEELANNLAAHMAIEQEIFYPAIQSVDKKLISESFEEHALAEVSLKRLLATDPEADEFKARATALRELIQHHVEEEETELFPKVEKKLGEEQLEQLEAQMKRRFAEVLNEGFEAAVPRGFARTSADVSRKMMNKRRAA
ncbi:MAG TPA: hemerythrin domain-containing protein [Polyangiales bacterium]|nr:hemerythrin domain-containing protein [Polyangiales bacterium]